MSASRTPKAESVHEDGTSDGWTPIPGFLQDIGAHGRTQLVVSTPPAFLASTHRDLVSTLEGPCDVRYVQHVDRAAVARGETPPQGQPPRDFVALGVPQARVIEALSRFTGLLHHDARGELWVRGSLGDEVVLDPDGMLFARPDDPAFRDLLLAQGFVQDPPQTLAERDYVKHWFHAEHDDEETGLIEFLGLVEVAPQT